MSCPFDSIDFILAELLPDFNNLAVPNIVIPEVQIPEFEIPPFPFSPDVLKWNFPSFNEPGLPSLLVGLFVGSMMAGVNYVLSILPPDPEDLPELPTIDIFVDGFTAAIPSCPQIPSFKLNVPGVPSIPVPNIGKIKISLPEVPSFNFDPDAIIKIIKAFISAPFLIFKQIVEDIISNLTLVLPTLSQIKEIFKKVFLDVKLPKYTIDYLIDAISEGVMKFINCIF